MSEIIDVQFSGKSDFDELIKASEKILNNAKETQKLYNQAGDLSKLAKAQQQMAVSSERLRVAEEKKKEQLQQQQGIMGSLVQQQKELRKAQQAAQNVSELTAVNGKMRDVKQRLSEITNQTRVVTKDTRGWSDAITSFQFKFNFLGNMMTGIMTSLTSKMKQFVTSSVQAFMVQEKADKKLLVSLNNNVAAFDRLKRAAGDFQKQSVFGDEVIQEQMAFLTMQGRSEQQIIKTTKAAIALSRATGVSLQDAVRNLDATFEGNIGRLGRLDKGFKNLTAEQLANGDVLDLVIKKYGSAIDAVSMEDKLQQTANSWGDLKEQFGSFAAEIGSVVLPELNKYFTELNEYIAGTKEAISRLFGGQIDEQKQLINIQAMSKKQREEYFSMLLRQAPTEEAKLQIVNNILKARQELNEPIYGQTAKIGMAGLIVNLKEQIKFEDKINEVKRERIEIQQALTGFAAAEARAAQDEKARFELYYNMAIALGLTHKEAKKVAQEGKELIKVVNELDVSFKKLNEGGGGLSETTDNIYKTEKAVHKFAAELKRTGNIKDAFKSALGLDDAQVDSLMQNLNTVKDSLSSFLEAKNEGYKQDVANSSNRIQELQGYLQAELQLNQQGHASDIQMRLQQIEAEEQIRQRAVDQQMKIQKQMSLIDQAMTIASTATAVANTFKVWSNVPFVGPILAGVQVAAMLLQISAAKQKAKTIATFGDGGRVSGKTHAQGGVLVEAEDKEWIINAGSSGAYNNTLQAINDKHSPDRVLQALQRDNGVFQSDKSMMLLSAIANKLPDKNQKEVYYNNGQKVYEKWGNTIRYYN